MSHIGTRPPSGVKESCIEFTEPLEAAVVAVAHRAELVMPKRTSFPSMFPPGCVAEPTWSAPAFVSAGLPDCSAPTHTASITTKRIVIVASNAQPWRVSPISTPKV